jgi:hypothetical protein
MNEVLKRKVDFIDSNRHEMKIENNMQGWAGKKEDDRF